MKYLQVFVSSGAIYVHFYYNILVGQYILLVYNYDIDLVHFHLSCIFIEALDGASDYINCVESTGISFYHYASRRNLNWRP